MLNLVISYTSNWQGHAIARWGYPTTLALDAGLGMIGIALLPFLIVRKREASEAAAAIPPGSAIPEAVSP
jgi:hypothetical protein